VTDKTMYFPGPAYSWLLALDRRTPKAYLIGTNRSDIFAANLTALFAAEKVTARDEPETLALAELVVSLIRYSAYSRDFLRKDLSPAQVKAWGDEQLAKFSEPAVQKDTKYRVNYPVYQTYQHPPQTKTLINYEVEFGDKGLGVKSTSTAIQYKNLPR
jgi:hypothetical protein